jgi:hypothetical protein
MADCSGVQKLLLFKKHEQAKILNMNTPGIDRAATALEALGLRVHAKKPPRTVSPEMSDGWWQVQHGKARLDYVVEAKRGLTLQTLGTTLLQLRRAAQAAGRPALLVADHVSIALAEKLREHGQQFADGAGNVFLEGPGLLIYVVGRKKPALPGGPNRPDAAFNPAGLKLMFALMCRPLLADAPQRTIAAAAGVALGGVPAALADLQARGHLLVAGRHRRLDATKRLLDQWVADYARRLRHKTLRGRYVAPHFGTWANWQIDPPQARWGGEPAANLLVGHLTPGVLTLYTDRLAPRLQVEQKLVAAGAQVEAGVVEVRQPFWGDVAAGDARPDTVPPVLVYADLLATGDARCIETAQLVYDRYLARLLPDR